MQITLKDIAEELNLSVTAVSRALRNMPDISKDTTNLVKETARRLGYKKNLAASYLKTARSMTLGVIVPDICNPVFSYMYKGIENKCREKGYTLMLGISNEESESEVALAENMISHGIDGIFIVPSKDSETDKHISNVSDLPCIVLQRKRKSGAEYFVQSNDYEGGYLAAEHLYERGHRKFILVFADMRISSARERYGGFTAYLQNAGLFDAVELIECNGTRAGAYEAINSRLEKTTDGKTLPASAIFCFSDYIACGVYSALEERGISVPSDVSVVGYDNNEYAGVMSPALTTVDILPYEIGDRAAEMMLKALGGACTEKERQIVISPHIVVRNSTKNQFDEKTFINMQI